MTMGSELLIESPFSYLWGTSVPANRLDSRAAQRIKMLSDSVVSIACPLQAYNLSVHGAFTPTSLLLQLAKHREAAFAIGDQEEKIRRLLELGSSRLETLTINQSDSVKWVGSHLEG